MIVLLHGSGDDTTKHENWMNLIKTVLDPHELVLILPGVGSGEKDKIFDFAYDFLSKLGIQKGIPNPTIKRKVENKRPIPAGLRQDLIAASSARSEFEPLVMGNAMTADPITALAMIERQVGVRRLAESKIAFAGPESGLTAVGIKSRAAIVAICAQAYHHYFAGEPKQIRIIGHSRGGSAAIAAQNLLRLFGIHDVRTLALDPCHGIKKVGAKNYTHKVYSGIVVSIPARKEVGGTSLLGGTLRQPITKGVGADQDTIVFNHPILKDIEHGHMGKLDVFQNPGFFTRGQARTVVKDRKKAAQEAILSSAGSIDRNQMLKQQVMDIFSLAKDRKGDIADKKVIYNYVNWLLFEEKWQVNTGLITYINKAIENWNNSHGGLKGFTRSAASIAVANALRTMVLSIEGWKPSVTEDQLRYAIGYFLNCSVRDEYSSTVIDLRKFFNSNNPPRLNTDSSLYRALRDQMIISGQFVLS